MSSWLQLTPSFIRLHPVEAELARQRALRDWLVDMVLEDRAESALPPEDMLTPIVPWWRQ